MACIKEDVKRDKKARQVQPRVKDPLPVASLSSWKTHKAEPRQITSEFSVIATGAHRITDQEKSFCKVLILYYRHLSSIQPCF